ncbi:hypothetical protein RED65_09874 [Oceanobacter sp. RED65]|uniref:Uncharacterized protein n=1 Tax=Bermanella marisrubri TaxID=207949 RepID=Q1N6A1_9GAMM|nr:hypothetical protein RED65_09874 [Oceanobacter sp. RED65] [Bermanella marisrubri]
MPFKSVSTILKKNQSKEFIVIKTVLAAVVALSLVACSGPSRTPQEQAISYALIEDVTLRKLQEECTDVSTSAKQSAWRGQRSWWKRNGGLVKAADYGLSYNVVTLTDDRLETGARYAMGLTFDIVHAAEENVKALLAGDDKEKACMNVMSEYRDGDRDLQQESEHYPVLVKLQQEREAQGDDHYLKISRLEKQKGEQYSRSAYTVERLVKRQGCVKPKVRTLKANGPNEVLEATCADDSFMLIRCEWRNCKIQK